MKIFKLNFIYLVLSNEEEEKRRSSSFITIRFIYHLNQLKLLSHYAKFVSESFDKNLNKLRSLMYSANYSLDKFVLGMPFLDYTKEKNLKIWIQNQIFNVFWGFGGYVLINWKIKSGEIINFLKFLFTLQSSKCVCGLQNKF